MISTRIADRYVLLAPLGSGGEARVFRARDEQGGGEVAVRLALGDVKAVMSAPTAQLNPAWVRYIDSGIDPQHGAYQVFELLEGKTLGEMVKDGFMDANMWRPFVDRSLSAIESLHQANWIHGDINADNFMLTGNGWKLIELPFYHFETPAARSTMFGSIYTIAPEQIDGSVPSVRSDLYSLGCLYYRAACGGWPHSGNSAQEVAIHSLMHPADDLKGETQRIPAPWCDWVMRLIALEPNDRPPSVAAARQLLAEAVA
jgi:serine/threonine protein kinase